MNKNKIESILLWLIASLLFVSLILPLIYLSFFTFPGLDDVCMKDYIGKHGLVNKFINWYNYASGRYSVVLLMGHAFIYELPLYRAISAFTIITLTHSIFFLQSSYFGNKHYSKFAIISIITVTLAVFQLRSLPSAFYWFAGSFTYTLPVIFGFYFCGYLIKYCNSDKRINAVLTIIFLFFLIGSNEQALLAFNLIISSALLVNYVTDKSLDKKLLSVFIFCIIFSALFLTAPGNYSRMGNSNGVVDTNIIIAFKSSFINSIISMSKWCTSSFIAPIFVLLTFLSLINQSFTDVRVRAVNPFFVLMLTIVIIWASHFPSFLIYDNLGAGRVQNYRCFLFVGLLLFNIMNFTNYINSCTRIQFPFIKRNYFTVLYLIIPIILLGFKNRYNYYFIKDEIVNAIPQKYVQEMQIKFDLIKRAKNKAVINPNYYKPRTFVFQGIEHKINRSCYSRLNNVKIVIKEDFIPPRDLLHKDLGEEQFIFKQSAEQISSQIKLGKPIVVDGEISLENTKRDIGYMRISIDGEVIAVLDYLKHKKYKKSIKNYFRVNKNNLLKFRFMVPNRILNKDSVNLEVELINIAKTKIYNIEKFRLQ